MGPGGVKLPVNMDGGSRHASLPKRGEERSPSKGGLLRLT